MKKTLTLLFITTIISFYAKAQDTETKEYVKSYLSLIAGISNPTGNFGKTDYNNNSAGFAKRGVTFGLDGAFYFYKNLGIGATVSFQDQGELVQDNVQALANGYNAAFKENSTLVQAVDRYHSINYMAGPQYSFTYHKFILDLRASAGIIKSSSTPSLNIYLDGVGNSSTTIVQNKSAATAFAYGGIAGLRWQFADGWDIGIRANYIDSKGLKISTTGETSKLTSSGARLVTRQPVTVIQTTFGIGVHF